MKPLSSISVRPPPLRRHDSSEACVPRAGWPQGLLAALCGLLLALPGVAANPLQQPIDVLREQVAAGIEVLKDPAYDDPATHAAQRERLCAIANGMFDVYAFSRLVLMGGWNDFDAAEQDEFVSVFGDFLCRYYLSRLQLYYADEEVRFGAQEMKSDTQAVVSASVLWQGNSIPVEVRMGRRAGRWRAYDILVGGISAVLVYRAQFQPLLLTSSPREIIADLRRRIAEQG
ncbi:MAG: ABC transporter substrate-binding protein [Gammaproteobacteria bacterium]|nr:ABC transporter substrate-binding protein [Gammaproteobacteria bacterium]MCP5201030.1 ABC transporter substrate-binding protein [Gammaproteobacteria bacterium]